MDFSLLPPLKCRYYSAWEREITAPGPGKGEGGRSGDEIFRRRREGLETVPKKSFLASPLHTFRSSRCNDLYYHQPSFLLRRSSVHSLTPTKDNPFIEDCGVFSVRIPVSPYPAKGCRLCSFSPPAPHDRKWSEGGGEMCVVGVGSGGESRRRKSWGGATFF